ncbi:MAG: bifunctional folylpolyglutamate synthase/dihydrofolate synthase [Coxiellaceae bacterium]|nr:bifunctional folylpolyglutamate synthase/dihydrofolate synthase [Coxiellaceae bacterium]
MSRRVASRDLAEWIEHITRAHPKEIKLGLERISKQAQKAELLVWDCPVILVAGTNGKGSCVKLMEQMYVQAGYRVASYYSPHLINFNERICLNGESISDNDLVQAFEQLDGVIGSSDTTYFEYTTLVALQAFKNFKPDVVIAEVGLGGRLDAINILDADASIITSIGLDHCEYLGNTREAIATEKAGIFRKDAIAICGDTKPPTTIAQQANKVGARLLQWGADFDYRVVGNHWQYFGVDDCLQLPIPQLKCQNAATALTAVQALQSRLPVNAMAILRAMKSTRLAGRFEQHSQPIPMVLDVAHNADSADYLAKQCQRRGFTSVSAVVGILKTKNIAAILKPLLPYVEQWHVVELPDERGVAAAEIRQQLANMGAKNCYTWASVDAALQQCSKDIELSVAQSVLVYGSFVTVGLAKQWLQAPVTRRVALEYTN